MQLTLIKVVIMALLMYEVHFERSGSARGRRYGIKDLDGALFRALEMMETNPYIDRIEIIRYYRWYHVTDMIFLKQHGKWQQQFFTRKRIWDDQPNHAWDI